MKDDEIIKALRVNILNAKSIDCKVWSIEVYKLENTLDLINRQKAIIEKSEKVEHFADKAIETANAEIERLDIELQSMRNAANSYKVK